jgi:hypothetical protein
VIDRSWIAVEKW